MAAPSIALAGSAFPGPDSMNKSCGGMNGCKSVHGCMGKHSCKGGGNASSGQHNNFSGKAAANAGAKVENGKLTS